MESGTTMTSKPVKSNPLDNVNKTNKKLFLFVLIVIIIFIIIIVIITRINRKRQTHLNEINKIIDLETRTERRKRQIEIARANTTRCLYGTYHNPRDCYFGSNYRCHWSEEADRCNLISQN